MANSVCHIPPPTQPFEPRSHDIGAIPDPTDLKSAIDAIRALKRIIEWITDQAPQRPNEQTGRITSPSNKPPGAGKKPPRPPRFIETKRSEEIIRVYNPQDKEQWVDVKRINRLTMADRKTGETWDWRRS